MATKRAHQRYIFNLARAQSRPCDHAVNPGYSLHCKHQL